MKIEKQKILQIVFIIVNTVLPFLYTFTNGKEQIVKLYPMLITIILLLIIFFNCYSIYQNNSKFNNILLIISSFLSFFLISVYPILYLLMLLSYFIIFFYKRKKTFAILFLILFAIFFQDTIRSNYFKMSHDSFNILKETVDLGFSPSKKYYGFCRDNTLYVHMKKDVIDIIGQFSGWQEKSMDISTCEKDKIKWITDDMIEVDGNPLPIKDKVIKFIDGQRVE